ncbi:MAG: phosphotriesterase-related protein [Chloroflexi bacterium]|jgi:phosphotriesterase-related protein|nr:MAG: phosphotriesterase-related protein [Chloroflexota bacterium]
MNKEAVGKIVTVLGLVEPEAVGPTMMHEHIFIDFWRDKALGFNAPVTDVDLWDQKLTLENLHLARDRKHVKDNYMLTDENRGIKELNYFLNAGGSTVVDVTSIGLGRDPKALQRVSLATGLNIVMGAGWYQKFYHPSDMDTKTVEELTEVIVADVTEGVDGSKVRSGIIGEVGINGAPLTDNEVKSVRASARASRQTGTAISFHNGGTGREKLEVAGIVGEEGADLNRVVFGHSNTNAGDVSLLLELLDLGTYIQFDTLGRVGAPMARYPNAHDTGANRMFQSANDVLVAEAIPQLIEAGFEDRILLSQDVCMKMHLKAYGGTGYSYVMEKFTPYLRYLGVTDAQVDKMLTYNPRRVLTRVAPM